MSSLIAVLTGDLIRSTDADAGSVDAALAVLGDAAEEIAKWQSSSARFTRARGDGWQMYLTNPSLCLRACLYLRASLLVHTSELGSRISVGIGTGVLPQDGDLNSASGPAFVLSGRGLEAMSHNQTLACALEILSGGAVTAVFSLADSHGQNWTQAMARSLAPMLLPNPPSQSNVASRLGLSKQAVRDALKRVDLHTLQRALQAFENEPF